MSRRFTAVIIKEEGWYVAHCVELGVVSQGKTIEEAQANLKEAVELYLESFGTEDLPQNTGEVVFYPLEVAVNA
ncbi:MAG: type II toxin-antitoxin system HicB family antitoxin [Deltaproteobacteria bacterium]|nr:type II toxin-antitoxin system HicB family antitoxin [Deltaproteobacteria bacterium]